MADDPISTLTEGWRKLAFQIMPSSGPYSGGFSTDQVLDYLAGRQMPYAGGPSNDAQWLRIISLIVYGGAQGGGAGTDFGGGGSQATTTNITNKMLLQRMAARRLRLVGPRDTTADSSDAQVTNTPTPESSNPQDGSGLELGALRVTFNVHKRTQQTPDLFEARVYNLSPQTRQQIIQFGRVQLSVGYKYSSFGMVFDGTVVQYRHGKENAVDTYLDIIAGDGDKMNNATTFRRFPAGTQEKDVLNTLAQDTGFPIGFLSNNVGTQSLVRPWVIAGGTMQYMREIAQKYGADYWVDRSQLYIMKSGEYLPDEAVVLSPTTGMVGIPEDTPNGIQVRCLINPRIQLGGRVKLDSTLISGVAFQPGGQEMTGTQFQGGQTAARYGSPLEIPQPTSPTGDYKIVMMEISGDTRGRPWYMDLVCVALDGQGNVIPQTNQSAWNRSWVAGGGQS